MPSISKNISDIIREYKDFNSLYTVAKEEKKYNVMLQYSRHMVLLRNQLLKYMSANPKELSQKQDDDVKEIFEGIASPETVRKEIMEKDHSEVDEELKKNTELLSPSAIQESTEGMIERIKHLTGDTVGDQKKERKVVHQTKRDVVI
jgi:hypothetical protein